jgi:hypothetical protein
MLKYFNNKQYSYTEVKDIKSVDYITNFLIFSIGFFFFTKVDKEKS